MAEIVQGLFGVSPESLNAQREQALQAQALQYAQLDPNQQAQMGFYQAGSRLGTGLAGMMGAQDPEMQKASFLQGLSKQYDPTTSEGLTKMAQAAAQAGYGREAMQAGQAAQEMVKQVSARKLEESKSKYYANRQVAGAGGALGKIRPEAYTPDSLEEFNVSLREGTPDYSLLELKDPVAKQQALSPAGKQASEEGFAPGTEAFISRVKEVNLAKGDKPLSASLVKDLADTAQKVNSLQSSGAKLDVLIPTVQQMDLGVVSNFFRSGASALGINTADRTKFDAMQRTITSEASKLLLMAKGTQTEGDAQRAVSQIVSPDTWKNADALKSALQDLQDTHKAAIAELQARQGVLNKGGQPASKQMASSPAAVTSTGVDWNAAFARQKALNPQWNNFTLEQFKQKAGAK